MSLAISIGVLTHGLESEAAEYDLQNFRKINRLLAAHELPLHDEPQTLPKFSWRGELTSFPYAWLPYLLRAVAFSRRAPAQFIPVQDGENPAKHPHLDAELYTFAESHLICHSRTEGYFVPIDFEFPLCDNHDEGLTGRVLGSSQRALAELIKTAPLLEITLQDKQLPDVIAQKIAQEPDESHPCWIERKVWFALYESFRTSVDYKCAVVYG
ncbi:hypothetical protein [Anatilimnocola floriformis]|uniref:hypothetical protein n=1 Tax=Anatilimnocola floriformis TaxID=2948575 RepID=UPI0020C2DB92|nr:hypothetical protein [Anatilimnocola floriformis]